LFFILFLVLMINFYIVCGCFFFFFFFFLRGCSIILKDETLPFLILNIFLWRVTISNSDNFLSLIIVHIQSIIRLSITMHPSNFIIFL
jgi:hypothetical protein